MYYIYKRPKARSYKLGQRADQLINGGSLLRKKVAFRKIEDDHSHGLVDHLSLIKIRSSQSATLQLDPFKYSNTRQKSFFADRPSDCKERRNTNND